MGNFKDKHTLQFRAEEAYKIKQKYPDRVPIIVERSKHTKNVPLIDKKKFLVPNDLTIGQFIYIIRKRMNLPADMALFVFIDSILPPTASLIETIYSEYHDQDGFLYMEYTGENTFG
jgi:GABA(A) receptor-associated protein